MRLLWAIVIIPVLSLNPACAKTDPANKEIPEKKAPPSLRTFGSFDLVTREELAVLVLRAKEGEPPTDYCAGEAPFSDVTPAMWSCRYVKRLKEVWKSVGITLGHQDGTFRPYTPVTREQMAAFVIRAVEGDPPIDSCKKGAPYADVAGDAWSCKYIKRLKDLGVAGKTSEKFFPYDTVTYEEVQNAIGKAFGRSR